MHTSLFALYTVRKNSSFLSFLLSPFALYHMVFVATQQASSINFPPGQIANRSSFLGSPAVISLLLHYSFSKWNPLVHSEFSRTRPFWSLVPLAFWQRVVSFHSLSLSLSIYDFILKLRQLLSRFCSFCREDIEDSTKCEKALSSGQSRRYTISYETCAK